MIAAVTDDAFAGLRAAAPTGVEVRRLSDGLDRAEFVVPRGEDPLEALEETRSLRVVQSLAAGTDWLEPHVPPWATLCNARGARDIPVAEWVVGALLGAAYGQFRAAGCAPLGAAAAARAARDDRARARVRLDRARGGGRGSPHSVCA